MAVLLSSVRERKTEGCLYKVILNARLHKNQYTWEDYNVEEKFSVRHPLAKPVPSAVCLQVGGHGEQSGSNCCFATKSNILDT